jgi:hypothetical protein
MVGKELVSSERFLLARMGRELVSSVLLLLQLFLMSIPACKGQETTVSSHITFIYTILEQPEF